MALKGASPHIIGISGVEHVFICMFTVFENNEKTMDILLKAWTVIASLLYINNDGHYKTVIEYGTIIRNKVDINRYIVSVAIIKFSVSNQDLTCFIRSSGHFLGTVYYQVL